MLFCARLRNWTFRKKLKLKKTQNSRKNSSNPPKTQGRINFGQCHTKKNWIAIEKCNFSNWNLNSCCFCLRFFAKSLENSISKLNIRQILLVYFWRNMVQFLSLLQPWELKPILEHINVFCQLSERTCLPGFARVVSYPLFLLRVAWLGEICLSHWQSSSPLPRRLHYFQIPTLSLWPLCCCCCLVKKVQAWSHPGHFWWVPRLLDCC